MSTTAEEQIYRYQPVDDEGRPMGREQVIKYDGTPADLVKKLTEQNQQIQRQLRKVNRQNKLGQTEKEDIPETATRFQEPITVKPRGLTAEEKIQLAQDILNPEKMEAAFDKIATARFGAAPDQLGTAVVVTQQGMTDAQVKQEVQYFMTHTPAYYACKENYDTIINWMYRYNLEPTRDNFTLAFNRLTDAGILLQAPAPQPTVTHVDTPTTVPPEAQPIADPTLPSAVVPPPAAAPVVEDETPAYMRINTGLSGTGTSTGGGPVSTPAANQISYTIPAAVDHQKDGTTIVRIPARTVYGQKAIDAMPPEEYRARFNGEPGFKEKVNEIEKTRKWSVNQRY